METIDVRADLRQRLPELEGLVSDVVTEQLAWVAQVITTTDLPDAVHVIVCQAVNDLTDLLTDCLEGSGRSAMRAARSLYEHGVNTYTVLDGPTPAERYMSHLAQGPALLADLEPGADLLSGPARKAYEHRVRTSGRDASQEFEAAVTKYGSQFRRTWATANLKDRADTCGMGAFYDFYKLGSLVAHGSAGGSIGSRRLHPARADGSRAPAFVTYRTGKAIALCPIAMWGGVMSHMHVMQAIEQAHPSIPAGNGHNRSSNSSPCGPTASEKQQRWTILCGPRARNHDHKPCSRSPAQATPAGTSTCRRTTSWLRPTNPTT